MLSFFIAAVSILAVFRLMVNLGLFPVSLVGYLLRGERGRDIARQLWRWFGTLVIASLLAQLAWSTEPSRGRVVLYLAVGAALTWHMMYVGGHSIRQEGFKRGEWEGVEAGDTDIRLAWIPALAVIVFGMIASLRSNPFTSSLSGLFKWALDSIYFRFLVGVITIVCLFHLLITTGSMIWTGYSSLLAWRTDMKLSHGSEESGDR